MGTFLYKLGWCSSRSKMLTISSHKLDHLKSRSVALTIVISISFHKTFQMKRSHEEATNAEYDPNVTEAISILEAEGLQLGGTHIKQFDS